MNRSSRTVLFTFMLFAGFILFSGMGAKPPLVGGLAPVFSLADLKGNKVSLSDYQGSIILLNFWASWCKPCVAELPEIEAAYNTYKNKEFVVLAVNVGESKQDVDKFAKEQKLTFPILLDKKGNTAGKYKVNGMPVTYFIDKNGTIVKKVFGGNLTLQNIGEHLARIIHELS